MRKIKVMGNADSYVMIEETPSLTGPYEAAEIDLPTYEKIKKAPHLFTFDEKSRTIKDKRNKK